MTRPESLCPGIQVGRLIAPNYNAGLDKPSDDLEMSPMIGSKKPAITDRDGQFTLGAEDRPGSPDRRIQKSGPWPFASPIQSCAGFSFSASICEASRQPYEITLRPARQVRIPIEHEVTLPSGVLESWWELNDLAGASAPDRGIYVMQGTVKRNGPGQDSRGRRLDRGILARGKYRSRSTRPTRWRGKVPRKPRATWSFRRVKGRSCCRRSR